MGLVHLDIFTIGNVHVIASLISLIDYCTTRVELLHGIRNVIDVSERMITLQIGVMAELDSIMINVLLTS